MVIFTAAHLTGNMILLLLFNVRLWLIADIIINILIAPSGSPASPGCQSWCANLQVYKLRRTFRAFRLRSAGNGNYPCSQPAPARSLVAKGVDAEDRLGTVMCRSGALPCSSSAFCSLPVQKPDTRAYSCKGQALNGGVRPLRACRLPQRQPVTLAALRVMNPEERLFNALRSLST